MHCTSKRACGSKHPGRNHPKVRAVSTPQSRLVFERSNGQTVNRVDNIPYHDSEFH